MTIGMGGFTDPNAPTGPPPVPSGPTTEVPNAGGGMGSSVGGIDSNVGAGATSENLQLMAETKVLFPWLSDELVAIYVDAYVEYGDGELAWQAVRQSEQYETYFPGNRRDDGTVRMTEQEYTSNIEGYDDVFGEYNLNPQLFRDQYVALIEGDVSPDELMTDRVRPVYDRVLDQLPEIRAWYANQHNLELTDEAILAAALDPANVGTRILNREISLAEIGGEAGTSGFEINRAFAESLYEAGMDRGTADTMFAKAENFVPVLNILASRHDDPDDDFDLEEFVSADFLNDPQQRGRMRRLLAQESSLFTGGVNTRYQRSRTGQITGLAQS